MLKYYIKVIIRNLLKVFWIFPIDNKKLYFQSFGGRNMAGSPLYIFKYMYEKYPNLRYVWLSNSHQNGNYPNVKYVKKNTLKCIKEIMTSKVIIYDAETYSYIIPNRKKQICINTWHGGGAYKKVGVENKNIFYAKPNISKLVFISSSKKFTEIMNLSGFGNIENFISIGTPRNDVFFNKNIINNYNSKIRKIFNLGINDFIVLFAPTYRGTWKTAHFSNSLNTLQVRECLYKKYNKEIKILFRGHHGTQNTLNESDFDLDVSDYPNMQELLCATDLLITDYSSSMWDFSFLYRPCMLFAPDIDEYIKDRGFYTEPESWGFPICRTNEELSEKIKTFNNEKYIEAVKKHHTDLGSYEKGTATQTIVNYILNEITTN